MLISKQIADNPKFLTLLGGVSIKRAASKDAAVLVNLRVKIMSAVKIIVGAEFIDLRDEFDEGGKVEMAFSDGKPLGVNKATATPADYARLDKDMTQRCERFVKFCRAPYPLVTYESAFGLCLVEQIEGAKVRIYAVKADGILDPVAVVLDFDNMTQGNYIRNEVQAVYQKEFIETQILMHPGRMAGLQAQLGVRMLKLLDTMLHFNVANGRIHKYNLEPHEAKKIPPAMGPKYVYHILDVFRERTIYHSLRDVEDFAGHGRVSRRAHLVRGHFKEIRNRLFWWNPFVRCHKNVGTVGVVEKDYALH